MSQNKKFIKFEPNGDFYARLSSDCCERGEYINALEYANRALKHKPKSYDYTMQRGEVLQTMGLYEHSNKEFFRALALNNNSAEALYSISYNFFSMDELESALYYLRLSSQAEATNDDILEELQILENLFDSIKEDNGNSSGLKHKELMELAGSMMRLKQYSEARRIYKFIPETSIYYLEAQNSLAFAQLMLKSYQECEKILNKILERDPQNVFAHCTRLAMLKTLRAYVSEANEKQQPQANNKLNEKKIISLARKEFAQACNTLSCYIKEEDEERIQLDSFKPLSKRRYTTLIEQGAADLLAINDMDNSDLHRSILILMDLKKFKYASILCDRYFEQNEYSAKLRLCAAMAHYNSGNSEKAASELKFLLKINEADSVARYYSSFFHKEEGKNKIRHITALNDVPYAEAKKRLAKLKSLLTQGLESLPKNYSDVCDLVRWVLPHNDFSLQRKIFELLSRTDAYDDFLQSVLIDNTLNSFTKKLALRALIHNRKPKRVCILINHLFRKIKPRYPKILAKMPSIFTEVFAEVFASLAFSAIDFEVKLCDFAEKFFVDCQKIAHHLKNPEAIAACLVYRGRLLVSEHRMSAVAAIFNAKTSLLSTYNRLFNELEQSKSE